MPTYEYACSSCGIVEAFQAMRDEPLKKCPQCKRCKVVRIFSGGAGVIFKGSGFWETDYNRSSDYQKRSTAETPGTAGNGSSDTSTKPAVKTDAGKPATAATVKTDATTTSTPKGPAASGATARGAPAKP